jgi:transcriptional regulator NrdR family protein
MSDTLPHHDQVDRLAHAVSKFTCPGCGESASKVTNGRPVLGQREEIYRRTRRCLWCGFTFKTDEIISME